MVGQVIEDAATRLSVEYLNVLESALPISWSGDTPVCVPEHITADALARVESEMRSLLDRDLGSQALDAARKFGKDRIQTVGFGIAADFDQFAKLGFLCGERLVLWDVVHSRMLKGTSVTSDTKANICWVACNLLLLKDAVRRGAVSVLPHPITWSSHAQHAAEEIRQRPNVSNSHLGLCMALAAIAEGVRVHPFALLQAEERPALHPGFESEADEYYSDNSHLLHRTLTTLLNDERMTYLENIRAAEFQQIVSKFGSFQVDLRNALTLLDGLSSQQRADELSRRREALVKTISVRNGGLAEYALDAGAATVSAVASTVAVLNGGSLALLAAFGVSIQVLNAARKWFTTPERAVLVQAFQQVKKHTSQTTLARPLTLPVEMPDLADELDDETQQALEQFRNEMWTEDRHQYLLTLSQDLRRKLLRALTHDDLYATVNARRFQEDYIGDYVEDVWDIDEEAFWAHVSKMFEADEGLLIYDGSRLTDLMSSKTMPNYVWLQFLNSVMLELGKERKEGKTTVSTFMRELLTPIFYFQTSGANDSIEKQALLRSWLELLSNDDRSSLHEFITDAFHGGFPNWLVN